MSSNSVATTSWSRTTVSTRRRACRSPRFAFVMSCSASGRSRFAFVSVVVIRPWRNSWVARLARISRSCAGLPPRRGPLVGVGMVGAPRVVSCIWYVGASLGRPLLLLQLFGLAVVVGVVVRVREAVHDVGRVESRSRVLETKAHAGELHLDLVDRLLAEVPDVEQVRLGPADQLADGVDAFALEAVVGPYGQVQLLDRQCKIGSELRVLRR